MSAVGPALRSVRPCSRRNAAIRLRGASLYHNWTQRFLPSSTSARLRSQQQRCSWRTPERSCTASPILPQRRHLSSSSVLRHGHLTPPKPGEERTVTIVDQQGDRHEFKVADGDNLLDIAQDGELEMEGACGGSCACSTCHVIVEDSEYYDKMEEPDDDENDMLDLAFGLTETSRLGCQVKMSPELDGLVVKLPSMTRNLQKSDFEKK